MSIFGKCTLFFFGKKIGKVPTCGGKVPTCGNQGGVGTRGVWEPEGCGNQRGVGTRGVWEPGGCGSRVSVGRPCIRARTFAVCWLSSNYGYLTRGMNPRPADLLLQRCNMTNCIILCRRALYNEK